MLALTWLPWLLALAPAAASSDDDARDRLELTSGKVLEGRLLQRHGPEGIVFRVDGKLRRFAEDEVGALRTVRDHLSLVYERLDGWPASPELTWSLATYAESKGLHATAKLLALDLVLDGNGTPEARALLGHEESGGRWKWPLGARFVDRETFEEHVADWGHPLELASEHFLLRTDAGLRRGVDTLLDLERAYLSWMHEFAEPLQLWEAVEPMEFHLRASVDDFPAVTSRNVPYFYDFGQNGHGTTYVVNAEDQPRELFTIAAQCLLYGTLIYPTGGGLDYKTHPTAWAEMGLAQWFASRFDGPPGRVRVVAPALDPDEVALARSEALELSDLIQLRYNEFLAVSDRVPLRWASTQCLVHYLMDEDQDPNLRPRFLEYFRHVNFKRIVNSSSALDKALGERIESVEERYYPWLEAQAGVKGAE